MMASREAHRAMQRILDNPPRVRSVQGRIICFGTNANFPRLADKPINDPVIAKAVSDLADIMGRVRALETKLFGDIREINMVKVPLLATIPAIKERS